MSVWEGARLREREQENARLKRLLAERDLELDVTKELLAKSERRGGAARSGPGAAVQAQRSRR
jgi:hypothetical protein